jgi:AmiR/NasT family two-component response regulator
MTDRRLIQNFRGTRGILWAGSDFAIDPLERMLAKIGVTLSRFEEIDVGVLDPNRDVLFIDGDQPLVPGVVLRAGASLPIVPAVGIVGIEAPSRLKLLVEAGVTAFLRKPIHAGTVYSALFLGVNNHRQMQAMELRLVEHDRKRRGRRFVIKAIVALMQVRGLDDDEAYALLRRESMRRRLGIEESCEALLAEGIDIFCASDKTASGSSYQQEENKNASLADDVGRGSGLARTDSCSGGGSDQARRA